LLCDFYALNVSDFLAEYTNGRAYATVLCLSVTYVLWLNSASYRKTLKLPKQKKPAGDTI